MATQANIVVKSLEAGEHTFCIFSDGHPNIIVPAIKDMWKKSKSVYEFIGHLTCNLGVGTIFDADYNYIVDCNEKTISWKNKKEVLE